MFQWSRGCSDYNFLEPGDLVGEWLDRMDGWLEER